MRKLTVDVCDGRYAVCRFGADVAVPAELFASPGLVSATRTEDELSIICRAEQVPAGAKVDDGWRRLTVRGPLAFTLTGIMAALSGDLAAAGIALFALSTFDTDHLLIKETDLDRAVDALTEAGHEVLSRS